MTKYVITPDVAFRLASDSSVIAIKHEVLAPTLFRSQVLSVFYCAVRQGRMSENDARRRLDYVRKLQIRLLGDRDLQDVAWKIAAELKCPELTRRRVSRVDAASGRRVHYIRQKARASREEACHSCTDASTFLIALGGSMLTGTCHCGTTGWTFDGFGPRHGLQLHALPSLWRAVDLRLRARRYPYGPDNGLHADRREKARTRNPLLPEMRLCLPPGSEAPQSRRAAAASPSICASPSLKRSRICQWTLRWFRRLRRSAARRAVRSGSVVLARNAHFLPLEGGRRNALDLDGPSSSLPTVRAARSSPQAFQMGVNVGHQIRHPHPAR